MDVVAIDVATGTRRTLASTDDASFMYEQPALSPDGRSAVALRTTRPTVTEPWVTDLWLIDVATGEGRPLSPGDEPHITGATFAADSSALIVTTDCQGHAPLFHIDLASGAVSRLTDDGAWASPQPAPDGPALYALRSSMDSAPGPVRLTLPSSADSGSGAVAPIAAPGALASLPGRLEEVSAEAADGTALRAWLVLPEEASAEAPAPLALWVHGGPVSSWNGWHWRWNPWLLAARGWAVLLPDPAFSTGYGAHMIERGWGQWGGNPYTDLMTITDAALTRADLDSTRTAAMGGSYGGYMANWIAGHTDRFRAIVSHASLWALDQMFGTTDTPAEWRRFFGSPQTQPERYVANSPHLHVASIVTPMLVIHGDKDYRVPIGEALRLWNDLAEVRGGLAGAKFLYFPDENHWILTPGNTTVWYETVLAFLAQHVLGDPWRRPDLL
jgi:dipeptidyl aminopeptidase/acylaminoacyl peptidase